MTDSRDLPLDPQRTPWSAGGGRVRAGYREQLRVLDADLVGLARGVINIGAPIVATDTALASTALADAEAQSDQVQIVATRLEDAAFTLVALESPVAEDLREMIALIRALHDLERTARLMAHVIEHLLTLQACGQHAIGEDDLGCTRVLAVDLFSNAVDAWADRDALAVNDLALRDAEVDRRCDAMLDQGVRCGRAGCAAALALVARFLERIADHGVALGVHLSWAITGDRVLPELAGRR